MRLLGVRVEVVQPRHPDVTDRTHVGLLARVNEQVWAWRLTEAGGVQ